MEVRAITVHVVHVVMRNTVSRATIAKRSHRLYVLLLMPIIVRKFERKCDERIHELGALLYIYENLN